MCRTSRHTGPSKQWLNVQYTQYKDNSDSFNMWSTCTPPWWPFTLVQDYWRGTRKFTHSLLSAVCMTTFEQQWLHWTISPWTTHALMLCKVTHSTRHISANTRSHQPQYIQLSRAQNVAKSRGEGRNFCEWSRAAHRYLDTVHTKVTNILRDNRNCSRKRSWKDKGLDNATYCRLPWQAYSGARFFSNSEYTL